MQLNGYMSFATEKKFGKICHEFPNAKFSSGACNVSSSYKGTSKVFFELKNHYNLYNFVRYH